jgi:hypothetical protein
MEFGDPVIYKCPSCKKNMKKTTYLSYSVHRSRSYSDGHGEASSSVMTPHNVDIDLAKCPYCAAVFFLHNLKGKVVTFWESHVDADDVAALDLEELLKAEDNNIAQTFDEQFKLRMKLWHGLNMEEYFAAEGGKSPKKRKLRYEKNAKMLLKLVKEKINEAAKKEKDNSIDDYDDEENEEYDNESLIMIAAELCRNLERFDECLSYLKKLPQDYSWQTLVLADRAKKGERKTFEFLKSDWYRLRPRNGEMWRTWECGAEPSDAVLAAIEPDDYYRGLCLSFYGEGAMKDYAPLTGMERSDAPWCDPENMKKVKYFHFSDDIIKIGDYAFFGSRSPLGVPHGDNLEHIGKYAFSRSNISRARIPWAVDDIEEGAFAHCTKLKELEFDSGIKYIGDKAFFHCAHLSKIDIPRTVTSIGKEAFASCDEITEIIIGENVQTIGDAAFAKSKKNRKEEFALKSVTNKSLEPQVVNEDLFKNTDLSKVVLIIPQESRKAYKAAAVWKEFGKIKTIKKPVYKTVKQNDTPRETEPAIDYLSLLYGDEKNPSVPSESTDDYLSALDSSASEDSADLSPLPPPPQSKWKSQTKPKRRPSKKIKEV